MRAALVGVAVALLAVLGACSTERSVLDNPGSVRITCDEVVDSQEGDPCALEESCRRIDRSAPDCCAEVGTCVDGRLHFERTCRANCVCQEDRDCTFGSATCKAERCEPCISPTACVDCPDGWRTLTRNGCATCECGPPPECEAPGEACDTGAAGDVCYAGKRCAPECDATQPGCCTNTCAAAGCSSPAPVGCLAQCSAEQRCARCAAVQCECVDGAWSCMAMCVPTDLPLPCRQNP